MNAPIRIEHPSKPGLSRLEILKIRFVEILDEMDTWLDDARDDTFCEDLADFSLHAAEWAAILGFTRPPFEHVIEVSLEVYNAVNDIRERARVTRIIINSPFGLSRFQFGFLNDPMMGELISQTSSRVHSDCRSRLRQWKRALDKLDAANAKPASFITVDEASSWEATIFAVQRERESCGITESYLDESMARIGQAIQFAKFRNLSFEEKARLNFELGREAAIENRVKMAAALNDTIPSTLVESECAVETRIDGGREPSHELAKRAESYVREQCNGKFPGVRPLARTLKKSESSVLNAIRSSRYLLARKAEYEDGRKKICRERALTEVQLDQIPQMTESEPLEAASNRDELLAALVAEQKAEDRNDQRMAKVWERKRSQ
jgi:hypothetical protein